MPIRLITILLLATLTSLIWGGPSSVHSQNTTSATQRRELTPQEKRGKALYLRSEGSSGQEMTARIGELDVPASTLTCAGCHGSRGEGKTEGGVTADNLTWSSLTKPHEHLKPDVRKHPAFSDISFGRALTAGLDPAGNRMATAMPTYPLSQEDVTNLIAYLKRIDTDSDPGVTDTSILLGIALPEDTAMNGIGQSIFQALQAYFAELNGVGGIFNRKVELRVAYGPLTSSVANLKKLIDEDQVFALVSGITAGAEDGVAALTKEKEVPFVGPSTLLPQRGRPLNRYIFYLQPGLREQGRALVTFAAKKVQPSSRMAIVSPDEKLKRDVASAMEDQMKSIGGSSVETTFYAADKLNVVELVRDCRQKGIDSVFFLGTGTEASAILKESQSAGWFPTWYVLGSVLGTIPGEETVKVKDKFFYAFPTVPSDVSSAGANEFFALRDKYKLGSAHVAAQLSAIASAKTMTFGLKGCGKELSRECLIKALEAIHEYDTGMGPKITFNPGRRIGALGAYVITMDPEKKVASSVQWVDVQ